MPAIAPTLIAGIGLVVLWTAIGLGPARRIAAPALAPALAPVLGWAVHAALALPWCLVAGWSVWSVAGLAAGLALAGLALARRTGAAPADGPPAVPGWIWAAALLVALAIGNAVLPKADGDGIVLSAPIFDHAKVAIVDEIRRSGLPPGNPVFGDGPEPGRLAYYYLWHAEAAGLALVTGLSGWEADAALTGATAFASLMLMAGLATGLARRRSAAGWTVALALAGSLRPVLGLVWAARDLDAVLRPATGLGAWIFQAGWAPQHVMSASVIVLAMLLLARLATRPDPAGTALLALVAAAGFGSSTWIGGLTLAAAVLVAAPILAWRSPPGRRPGFLRDGLLAAAGALLLAWPLLHDQAAAAAAREIAGPVGIRPYPVLGPAMPAFLDPAAYWLVLLPVEFPAIVLTGGWALVRRVRRGAPLVIALAALTAAGLMLAWLGQSRIGDNNDLAWRAALPAVLVLTAAAAAALSDLIAARARIAALAGLAALALGLVDGLLDLHGYATAGGAVSRDFATDEAMWQAVRRHAGPDDRVASNPLLEAGLTPWPVNISWALLGDRRACFAGREMALAFAALPAPRRDAIDDRFRRIFAGFASPADIDALFRDYGCRVVLVTARDGAWLRDPFAASSDYRLVETRPGAWRIYAPADR